MDNRSGTYNPGDILSWRGYCLRRQGIGADGVLFLEKSVKADFKMTYLNSDGKEVSMCGNGLRAMTHFYHYECTDKKQNSYLIETQKGLYSVTLQNGEFCVVMNELYDMDAFKPSWFSHYSRAMYLNTGVPHVALECSSEAELLSLDLEGLGPCYRHDPLFSEGANINFYVLSADSKSFRIRTFERGVEAETLSCGTGITAVAHALARFYSLKGKLDVHTPGGKLQVEISENLSEIKLSGPVKKIYSGRV